MSEPRHAALVLASASPRRRELLGALGLPFEVMAADIDEQVAPDERPVDAAIRLARNKAESIAATLERRIVLGADTIVVLDGQMLGKPRDAGEAAAMLRALRGRQHTVITAVALHDTAAARCCTAAPQTAVFMRPYTDAEISASIAAGTPFDKAGAYAIQDDAFAPVARIDGCYCNVVGLPLWTLYHLLSKAAPNVSPRPPSAVRPACASCPLATASSTTEVRLVD